MRNMCILRLGELHPEFAMIRAIGSYISGSGWLKAGWFKENTLKHVLECSRINRALDAYENTLVALYILYLKKPYLTFLVNL